MSLIVDLHRWRKPSVGSDMFDLKLVAGVFTVVWDNREVPCWVKRLLADNASLRATNAAKSAAIDEIRKGIERTQNHLRGSHD